MNGIVVGVAVVVGYLLGRTRKLKLVMTLAAARASGRLGKNSAGLVKQGTELLGSSPEVRTLTETVRGRLLQAGKAAAVAAVNSQIDALSDRLQERTRSLGRPAAPTRGTGQGDDEADEGRSGRVAADEKEGYEEDPVMGEREERPRRRPAAAGDRPRPQHHEPDTEPEDDDEAEQAGQAGRPPVRRSRR
ncbi:hypothetical protein GCM10023195_86610 [Actinoallomurus liliacearum]|uniref:DNA primase n=1 Tax=Actinoallomurus liliacearum TaxID=1080073 RepID=A0ABP8TXX1_9ACTN